MTFFIALNVILFMGAIQVELPLSERRDRDHPKKVSETKKCLKRFANFFSRKVSETAKNGPVPLQKCLKRDELVSAGLGRPPARAFSSPNGVHRASGRAERVLSIALHANRGVSGAQRGC